MKKPIFIIPLMFMFFAGGGYAQENNITLEDAISEAKQNNFQIKAARQRYLSSMKNVVTEKTWEYPVAGAEYDSQLKNMFIVSQQIPFPGKLYLKGKAARKQAETARAELDLKIRETVTEVKKAYWKYWRAGKNIEIYRESLELLRRVSNISRPLYEVGKVPLSDVFKANIEIGRSESQLVIFEQEKISAQAELAYQLNRSTGPAPGNPARPGKIKLGHSLNELISSALKNSPELKISRYSYERGRDALALAKLGWAPDFSLGARFGEDYSDYIAQATFPLYFWKQSSEVSRAGYEKEAAFLDLHSRNAGLIKDVTDLYAQFTAHDASIDIYETNVIPLTKRTLSLSEEGYRSGRNSILDLLDSQKRYLDYSIEYYTHIVERETALAGLEELSGAGTEE